MLIDCDRCAVRGASCSGCVVNALFDTPDALTDLTPAELRAIELFELAGFDVRAARGPGATRTGAPDDQPPPRGVTVTDPRMVLPAGLSGRRA